MNREENAKIILPLTTKNILNFSPKIVEQFERYNELVKRVDLNRLKDNFTTQNFLDLYGYSIEFRTRFCKTCVRYLKNERKQYEKMIEDNETLLKNFGGLVDSIYGKSTHNALQLQSVSPQTDLFSSSPDQTKLQNSFSFSKKLLNSLKNPNRKRYVSQFWSKAIKDPKILNRELFHREIEIKINERGGISTRTAYSVPTPFFDLNLKLFSDARIFINQSNNQVVAVSPYKCKSNGYASYFKPCYSTMLRILDSIPRDTRLQVTKALRCALEIKLEEMPRFQNYEDMNRFIDDLQNYEDMNQFIHNKIFKCFPMAKILSKLNPGQYSALNDIYIVIGICETQNAGDEGKTARAFIRHVEELAENTTEPTPFQTAYKKFYLGQKGCLQKFNGFLNRTLTTESNSQVISIMDLEDASFLSE